MSSVISNEFENFLENNHLARITAAQKRERPLEIHNFLTTILLKGNAGGLLKGNAGGVSRGISYLERSSIKCSCSDSSVTTNSLAVLIGNKRWK